ncbi:hypothetical protein ES703_27238 [subsurface metagenome]
MNRRTNLKTLLLISAFLLAMGAPAVAKVIFVDANAPGPTHDGLSWTNAYKYLQDALTDANSAVKPVEIRVAEGIYTPDSNSAVPGGSGDREATFQLINGVTLKGGYAGFGQPDANARNIDFYETILSGDLDSNDIDVNDPCDLLTEPSRAENSYHVVCSYIADANAVLDGFTITSGNANGTYGANDGGGVYNLYGAPTIFNCTFIHNTALFGGGMFNYAFDPYGSGGQPPPEYAGNPFLNNCTFIMNSAEYSGGGMFNCCLAEPTVTNCVFLDNWADMFGGGMYNSDSNSIITNCTFSENSTNEYGGGMSNRLRNPIVTGCTFRKNSAQYGGGMDNWENSSPIVTNCIFVENEAFEGGGMFSRESSPRLINCTFSWNWCYGILNFGGGTVTLTNCILWGDWFGEEIAGGPVVVTYSNVQGGWPGEGNIDTNPCFAEPGHWEDPCNTPDDFWDDVWIEGEYHLKSQAGRWDANSESWVLDDVTSPCIDAGNPGCPLGDEPNDANNIRINMGAYGGTAEASKTPANWRNIADLTNDWTLDFNDLKVFVNYWLDIGECIPSDLNRNQSVDFSDFAIFGRQWSDTFIAEPGIEYQVDDCNMNSPVAAESDHLRFSVRVEGNNIYFEDLITANCCADEIELLMTVEDNLITIYEIEHLTIPCDCICDFPVTATLGPFEEGNYLVEVIDVNGYSLGAVEVTIGEPVEPSIAYQIEDCNQAASGLFAAEEFPPTRFSAVVEGRYIHFEDMMVANCCPDELGLEMTVEDNLITIYETEYTPGGCFCICDYPVTAALGPFEPGTYILEVYEDWGGFIGSTIVTIAPADF